MKKNTINKILGIDKVLYGMAGGIVGLLCGGVVPGVLGAFVGIFTGYMIKKDLTKIL